MLSTAIRLATVAFHAPRIAFSACVNEIRNPPAVHCPFCEIEAEAIKGHGQHGCTKCSWTEDMF